MFVLFNKYAPFKDPYGSQVTGPLEKTWTWLNEARESEALTQKSKTWLPLVSQTETPDTPNS